jgi:hypothetical protein
MMPTVNLFKFNKSLAAKFKKVLNARLALAGKTSDNLFRYRSAISKYRADSTASRFANVAVRSRYVFSAIQANLLLPNTAGNLCRRYLLAAKGRNSIFRKCDNPLTRLV